MLAESTMTGQRDTSAEDEILLAERTTTDMISTVQTAGITRLDQGASQLPAGSVYDSSVPPAPFENAAVPPPAPELKDAPASPRLLDYSWVDPLVEQIADWLRVFVEEEQIVELRALKVLDRNYPATWSGYYDWQNLDRMAEAAVELTARAEE